MALAPVGDQSGAEFAALPLAKQAELVGMRQDMQTLARAEEKIVQASRALKGEGAARVEFTQRELNLLAEASAYRRKRSEIDLPTGGEQKDGETIEWEVVGYGGENKAGMAGSTSIGWEGVHEKNLAVRAGKDDKPEPGSYILAEWQGIQPEKEGEKGRAIFRVMSPPIGADSSKIYALRIKPEEYGDDMQELKLRGKTVKLHYEDFPPAASMDAPEVKSSLPGWVKQ